MGFRQAAVLASVSFFTGVLFICLTVDHRILWALDDQAVQDGKVFYSTFYNAPVVIRSMLHGMMGLGIIGLAAKLHKWSDLAVYFDGTSLGLFVFGIVVYLSGSIPALRTVVNPEAGIDNPSDQVQALQLVSAGNIINLVICAFIFTLQAGQEYAGRLETKARASLLSGQETTLLDPLVAEKKTQ